MPNKYSGGWFLHPVKIGGEGYDDPNAKELATKEYVDSHPGGSGGASTWAELEGKPVVMQGGDTLYWYGNTEGKYVIEVDFGFGSVPFCHVSDSVVTEEEISQAVYASIVFSDGLIYDHSQIMSFSDFLEGGFAIVAFSILIVPHDDYVLEGITFAKKGIYFAKASGAYVTSFTISDYTGFVQETLDPVYLPVVPAEKLRSTVTLYADADAYLYRTEDTVSTAKRMTSQEFLNIYNTGANIRVIVKVDDMEHHIMITYAKITSDGAVSPGGLIPAGDTAIGFNFNTVLPATT